MRQIVTIIVISFLFSGLYSQESVYIDSEFSGDGSLDGSKDRPYKSVNSFQFKSNTNYYFKRNTEIVDPGKYLQIKELENVEFNAYGEGKKPVLNFLQLTFLDVDNLVLKNLVFTPSNDEFVCLHLRGSSKNVMIDSCIFTGGKNGIDGNCDNLTVKNSEIYNILEDGIILSESENVEIAYTYIHDVNQYYLRQKNNSQVFGATGDGIHFLGNCHNFHVHHCVIDRMNSGNKFGIIATLYNLNGVIEYNHLLGPKKTPNGGASIFMSGEAIKIRHNIIENAPHGIYNHSQDLEVYYNVFAKNDTGIFIYHPSKIYNNVFYASTAFGIHGHDAGAEIKNNIFYMNDDAQVPIMNRGNTLSANLVNTGSISNDDTYLVGDPMFINPDVNNFQLESSSPAIDQGVDVGLMTDFFGRELPVGSSPDVGVFEYDPEVASSFNNQPIAELSQSEFTFEFGTEKTFSEDISSDVDGDELSYIWTFPHILFVSSRITDSPTIVIPELASDTLLLASLRVSDGEKISDPFYFEINAVEEISLSDNDSPIVKDVIFSTYPNPTSRYLNVEYPNFNNLESIKIRLIDMNGKVILNNNYNTADDGIIKLDFSESHLNGMYLLLLNADGSILNKKVVIHSDQ